MIVREIMVSLVIAVRENCALEDAIKRMLDGNIGCLSVVNENGELTSIVTDSHFVAKEKDLPLSQSPRLLGEWLPDVGAGHIHKQLGRLTFGWSWAAGVWNYFGLSTIMLMMRPAALFTRHSIS